jgi:ABC-type uncharacterized transport system ATPase subunit
MLGREQRDRIYMMGKDVGRLDAASRAKLGFAFVPEDRLGRGAVPEMSLVLNSLLTAHPLKLLRHGLIDRARATAFTKIASVSMMSGHPARTRKRAAIRR